MNKSIIISAAVIAGGTLAAFLYKKYAATRQNNENQVKQRSHHVTNSFARAKRHATELT